MCIDDARVPVHPMTGDMIAPQARSHAWRRASAPRHQRWRQGGASSFHTAFARTFGFQAFYGRNMNAWIDCMTDLDDPGAGTTGIHCDNGDFVLLELSGTAAFKKRCPEQYGALLECSAFVNCRKVELGANPVLMLAFHQ
jgi:hypothetical protein